MAGKIKHKFASPVADEGVSTEVGPNEWNDSLAISEGSDGDVAVRRTAATDGWELRKLGASPTWVNTTAAQNSGAGETDLHSYTIPAAHFDVNNRAIRIKGWGDVAANANAKTLKLKLGTTIITLNPVTGSPNGVKWQFEATVIRTGSNAQILFVHTVVGVTIDLNTNQAATETDTATIILKVTGQGVASADIIMRGSTVEYLG